MSKALLDEKTLIVLPGLATKIGLNESIIIQQIHYWLLEKKNVREGYYWTYNSYSKWKEQFPFWSESTIKRTILSLESKNLLVTSTFNKTKGDKTKWYRINYEELKKHEEEKVFDGKASDQNDPTISSNWSDGEVNLTQPIPKSTTKITTNNNNTIAVVEETLKNTPNIPSYRMLSAKRKSAINARLSEYKLEEVLSAIESIALSDFFRDSYNSKANWYTIDWIFNPNNFLKILEGKYVNKKPTQRKVVSQPVQQAVIKFD